MTTNSEKTAEEKIEIIKNFGKKVVLKTKGIDYRIVDLVNENYWELIDDKYYRNKSN